MIGTAKDYGFNVLDRIFQEFSIKDIFSPQFVFHFRYDFHGLCIFLQDLVKTDKQILKGQRRGLAPRATELEESG
jgi:hypothetical protein